MASQTAICDCKLCFGLGLEYHVRTISNHKRRDRENERKELLAKRARQEQECEAMYAAKTGATPFEMQASQKRKIGGTQQPEDADGTISKRHRRVDSDVPPLEAPGSAHVAPRSLGRGERGSPTPDLQTGASELDDLSPPPPTPAAPTSPESIVVAPPAQAENRTQDYLQREEDEILRQAHLRQHFSGSHVDINEDDEEVEVMLGAGPGLDDNEESFEERSSGIVHIQWSLEYLKLIESATLDNDKLDEDSLLRLRNPTTPLTEQELAESKQSLDLYFKHSSAPESVYESSREHIKEFHDTELLSLHSVRKLVEQLSGIVSVSDDMCINGCHALQALQQTLEGSHAMRYRDRRMQGILEARLRGTKLVYNDIYCGTDLQNLAASLGVAPLAPYDILVGLSVDGAQLYKDKKSDTYFGIWIVYSYDPETRYKRRHILPAFIIPGPNKPKNIESFLFRSFYHLSALQRENGGASLKVYDAQLKRVVFCRVFFVFGTADTVALPDLDGRVGHHGARGCRLGCPMPGRHKPGCPHYYAVHLRPNFDPGEGGLHSHPDFDFDDIQVPSVAKYQQDLDSVISAPNTAAYEKARKATGVSKPSLISALSYALPPPKCFTVDLMHLLFNNIPSLMLALWRGTMKCEPTDLKDTWDWYTFAGPAWTEHGQKVADATENFPSSFHRPPRNPSEKLNSGFKATEYCLYFYGLGPGLFRTLLPEKYWLHYCKLVRAVRILVQRQITEEQMLEAHDLICQFVREFEDLYYQRRMDRIHFCRPCLHTLLHCAREIYRAGPGCYTTQFTLEGVIGLITGEIRQHSTPYANATQIMLRRSQWNAIQAMYPALRPKEKQSSKPTLAIAGGAVLLTPRTDSAVSLDSPAQAALLKERTGLELVRKWGRVQLVTGQKVRSRFQESKPTTRKRRATRMVKMKLNGSVTFGEVQFFFQHQGTGYSMVSVFSAPQPALRRASQETLLAMSYQGNAGLEIIKVEDIISLVSMQKLPAKPGLGEREDLWFPVEKSGLDDIRPIVRENGEDGDSDEED